MLQIELIFIQNYYHMIVEIDMKKSKHIKSGKVLDHMELQKVCLIFFHIDMNYFLLLLDDLALLYLKTVNPDRQKPQTHQSVIPLAKQFDLAHIHETIRQEKLNRQLKADMSRGIAIPYFQSEWGMAYTQQQHQQPLQTENVSPRGSRSAGVISNSNFSFWCNGRCLCFVR
jgi:hypothetical protein